MHQVHTVIANMHFYNVKVFFLFEWEYIPLLFGATIRSYIHFEIRSISKSAWTQKNRYTVSISDLVFQKDKWQIHHSNHQPLIQTDIIFFWELSSGLLCLVLIDGSPKAHSLVYPAISLTEFWLSLVKAIHFFCI